MQATKSEGNTRNGRAGVPARPAKGIWGMEEMWRFTPIQRAGTEARPSNSANLLEPHADAAAHFKLIRILGIADSVAAPVGVAPPAGLV